MPRIDTSYENMTTEKHQYLNLDTKSDISKPLEKLSSKGKSLISDDPVGYSSQLTNISNSAKNESSTSGLSDDEMEKTVAMIKKMEEAKAAAEAEEAAATAEAETAEEAADDKSSTTDAKKTADQVRDEILAMASTNLYSTVPGSSNGYLSLMT